MYIIENADEDEDDSLKIQQYEIIILIYILLIFFYAYKCNYFYKVEIILSSMWYTKLCIMNIFLHH